MYFYFYDTFTKESAHAAELTKVETRLIELGVNGRVERLTIFKNAKELIEDGIKKGAHTVVAVGDDKTLATVIDIAARYDVSIGFIPMVHDSTFAQLLGIPYGEEACTTLSRRLIKTVDVGIVDNHYFLGGLTINNPSVARLLCDDEYTVLTTTDSSDLSILCAGDLTEDLRTAASGDGRLEVIVTPTIAGGVLKRKRNRVDSDDSLFLVEKVKIESTGEPVTVSIDKTTTISTPCTVTIEPKGLKLIVGRSRTLR